MGRYSDKNVVITGGGSGIGFAMAKLLVDEGARVLITGRSQGTLDAARERLGRNAVAVGGNVASLSDLDVLADRAKGELGTIDALFVNAGIAAVTPFESTTEEVYDELFAINVKGAYFTVQKLAPPAEYRRRRGPHHFDRERHGLAGDQRLCGRQSGAALDGPQSLPRAVSARNSRERD